MINSGSDITRDLRMGRGVETGLGQGMIRAGLIGYGRWGPNLARCMAANRAFALKAICDLSPERLTAAAVDHGGVRVGREPDALVGDPDLDAIVVATPATTHYAIVRAALAAGKHVLVEKPIALASEEVMRLIAEADRRRCILMIDHTARATRLSATTAQ